MKEAQGGSLHSLSWSGCCSHGCVHFENGPSCTLIICMWENVHYIKNLQQKQWKTSRSWVWCCSQGWGEMRALCSWPRPRAPLCEGDTLSADRVGAYNGSTLTGKCVEGEEQTNKSLSSFFLSLFPYFVYLFILLLHFQDPFIEYPHQPSPSYKELGTLQPLPSDSSQPSGGNRSVNKSVQSTGKETLVGVLPSNNMVRSG